MPFHEGHKKDVTWDGLDEEFKHKVALGDLIKKTSSQVTQVVLLKLWDALQYV